VSVLSLLLCVATLVLWVRSYWRLDSTYYHSHAPPSISLHTLRGQLRLVVLERPATGVGLMFSPGFSHDSEPARHYALTSGSSLGFYFSHSELLRLIGVPLWSLALLFAILPALHLGAAIRSRRHRRAGRCPRCGYDLRATPERCPECGVLTAETQRTQSTAVL